MQILYRHTNTDMILDFQRSLKGSTSLLKSQRGTMKWNEEKKNCCNPGQITIDNYFLV